MLVFILGGRRSETDGSSRVRGPLRPALHDFGVALPLFGQVTVPGLFHPLPEVGITALPQAHGPSGSAQAVVDGVDGGSGRVQAQRHAAASCLTAGVGVRHTGNPKLVRTVYRE